MTLYEEAVAFKNKHNLFFHPLHDTRKRTAEIEKNGRRCPCRPEKTCICGEALKDCREKGSCVCLLFVTAEYLRNWCYIDEKGMVLSEKERKLLIKKRKKEKERKIP